MMRKTLDAVVLMALILLPVCLHAQSEKVGDFLNFTDIGSPAIPGIAKYNAQDGVYRLGGSGSNIWFDHDSFSFLWNPMSGDFIIQARIDFVGQGHDPHRKAGFMMRSSAQPDAKMIAVTLHGDGLTSLQWRSEKGQDVQEIRFETLGPDMLKMEKKGNTYVMSVEEFEKSFSESQKIEGLDLGKEAMVGLYICSHNDEFFEEAEFSDFSLIYPGY